MFRKFIYGLAAAIVGLGLTIVAFVGHQMFDDKHQYDAEDQLTNFVNWFKDTSKKVILEMIKEKETHETVPQQVDTTTNTTVRTDMHPSDLR